MKYVTCITYLFFLVSCSKKQVDDLGGKTNAAGRSKLTNPYEPGTDSIPYTGIIKLRYAGNNNTFIYSDTAEPTGNFSFTNLYKDKEYEVFAEFDSSGIPYRGITTLSKNNDNTLLIAPDSISINICLVKVEYPAGSPLNNARIYRFINQGYFNNSDLTGAIDDTITDIRGMHTYYDSEPSTYYYLVRVQINGIDHEGRGQGVVHTSGVSRDTVRIQ